MGYVTHSQSLKGMLWKRWAERLCESEDQGDCWKTVAFRHEIFLCCVCELSTSILTCTRCLQGQTCQHFSMHAEGLTRFHSYLMRYKYLTSVCVLNNDFIKGWGPLELAQVLVVSPTLRYIWVTLTELSRLYIFRK